MSSEVVQEKEYQSLTGHKTNALIRAFQEMDFNLTETKLTSLITLLINRYPPLDEKGNIIMGKPHVIMLRESYIEGFLGSHGSFTREIIKKSFQSLATNTVTTDGSLGSARFKWVMDFQLDAKKHEYQVVIDPVMVKYIYYNAASYTNLNWIYTFGMKSKYGSKFFELLSSYKFQKKSFYDFPIEDLKLRMGVAKKYSNSSNFRIKVLDPGISDVNEFTPLNVTYEKLGKIIRFKISLKSKAEVENIFNDIKSNSKINEMLMAYENILSSSSEKIDYEDYNRSKLILSEDVTKVEIQTEYRKIDVALDNLEPNLNEDEMHPKQLSIFDLKETT